MTAHRAKPLEINYISTVKQTPDGFGSSPGCHPGSPRKLVLLACKQENRECYDSLDFEQNVSQFRKCFRHEANAEFQYLRQVKTSSSYTVVG